MHVVASGLHLVAPLVEEVFGGHDLRPGATLPRRVQHLPVVFDDDVLDHGALPLALLSGGPFPGGLTGHLGAAVGEGYVPFAELGVVPAVTPLDAAAQVLRGVFRQAIAVREAVHGAIGVPSGCLKLRDNCLEDVGRVADHGVEGLVGCAVGKRRGRVRLELDHGPHLQPSGVAQENRVVVNPEGQHELSFLEEPRRGLQARLAVHAHYAPDQRVRLVTAALGVQPREHRRVQLLRELEDLGPGGHAPVADPDEHAAVAAGRGLEQLRHHGVEQLGAGRLRPYVHQHVHGTERRELHGAECCLDVHRHGQVDARMRSDGLR
mmetsp:Transcript_90300/g.250934  ORF Transcript_90300/g.250934 Transcript_90300/m.250934 type:complete len:321 (+) Transcript_90300:709-1671(+)